MSKVVMTTALLGDDGSEIPEGSFRTLRSTLTAVLFASIRGDENMDAEKKGKIAFLGLRVQHKDELELTAEDVVLLKDRVAKACPPLIMWRVHRLLEGKSQVPSAEELG